MSQSPQNLSAPSPGAIVSFIQESAPPRLAIAHFPDPHFREFCVTRVICSVPDLFYEWPFNGLTKFCEEEPEPLQVTAKLLEWLLNVPGIESCVLHPYRIGINKTPALEWSHLIDRIFEAIAAVVYPEVSEEAIEVFDIEAVPRYGEEEDSPPYTLQPLRPKRDDGEDGVPAQA